MEEIAREQDPARTRARLTEWNRICRRPQKVGVFGVPADSRYAAIMVQADYDMKSLVDGTDTLEIPGFRSLVDRKLDVARRDLEQGRPISMSLSSMNRFWFTSGHSRFARTDDATLFVETPVKLLTEQEHLTRRDGRRPTGGQDPMADAFCRSFTDVYEEIARARPIYAQLAGLYRVACCAGLMVERDGEIVKGFGLEGLLDGGGIPNVDVPDTVPGRSNIRELSHRTTHANGYSEQYLWLPSCGGVEIDCSRDCDEIVPHGFEIGRIPKQIRRERPMNRLSWNYQLATGRRLVPGDELEDLGAWIPPAEEPAVKRGAER